MIRIGIDVGGTHTDAAIVSGEQVVASAKTRTTADVVDGVANALREVLARAAVPPDAVAAVMVGTTQFTNAVVERRDLAPTAVVRLGLPATASLPPLVDWPEDLVRATGGHAYLAHGGHEFDGREIAPLDEAELTAIFDDIRSHDVRCVAISSVFSPVSAEHERKAATMLSAALPGTRITLSSEIGRMGLLERENAAFLNACLSDLSARVIGALRAAIAKAGVQAALYLTQNDGTLMDAAAAERFPVATFASGPTNSIRGAAYLSGVADAVVVDIGGTTTDVGLLQGGFPRQAPTAVDVGGVRTNFRMPEVFSLGLGGGSLVRPLAAEVTVGPESVGYRLSEAARVFGGDVLTATDVAVALGNVALGDPARLAGVPRTLIAGAGRVIANRLEVAVERARVSANALPVIVVGGGSILIDGPIAGLPVHKPDHYAVANAVGAAIAQVSGEIDQVYALADSSREAALHDAGRRATEAAVRAGADPAGVVIADVENVPLAYLPGNAVRLRVKAVGNLRDG